MKRDRPADAVVGKDRGETRRDEEEEVEVTLAMIAAGRAELENGYLGEGVYDLMPDRLAAVFRKMFAAMSKANIYVPERRCGPKK